MHLCVSALSRFFERLVRPFVFPKLQLAATYCLLLTTYYLLLLATYYLQLATNYLLLLTAYYVLLTYCLQERQAEKNMGGAGAPGVMWEFFLPDNRLRCPAGLHGQRLSQQACPRSRGQVSATAGCL